MSKIFKASILLTFFFAVNKLVALVRQALIARQFGFGAEIDAFNVANNLPDLVLSLFSGGALALAFIPVFAEYIQEYGKKPSWKLFSKTANLLFVVTALVSIVLAIVARPIVESKFGISPGFSAEKQDLVVALMRINFIALLIFSISGLIAASLQAHKHFFLTALAPIFYNIGVIIGVMILAPSRGFEIWGVTLPAFGFGIYGLVYGTILGALFHLAIQIPGLLKYEFSWTPIIDFKDEGVKKVLRLTGPRVATVFFIQLIFLARDNFASYLPQGSVTALTYGYFILQVPETLIGTAIATALLPTISTLASSKKHEEFAKTVNSALRFLIASSVGITVLLSLTLPGFIELFFDFNKAETALIVWVTRGYLLGLLSQVLLEVVIRAFYARQNAKLPLIATFIRTVVFLVIAFYFSSKTGAFGLAIADTIAVTVEVVILLVLLYRIMPTILHISDTLVRSILGSVVSAGVLLIGISFLPFAPLVSMLISLTLASCLYLLFVMKEVRILMRL